MDLVDRMDMSAAGWGQEIDIFISLKLFTFFAQVFGR
jgi:hypothetical protein